MQIYVCKQNDYVLYVHVETLPFAKYFTCDGVESRIYLPTSYVILSYLILKLTKIPQFLEGIRWLSICLHVWPLLAMPLPFGTTPLPPMDEGRGLRGGAYHQLKLPSKSEPNNPSRHITN